jgi:hypothetical protein
MPAKPETKLYQRLKENLPNCLISRIESRVNQGFPDCLIALRRSGTFVPVELKVVTYGRRVRLSPHQIAFHSRHAEIGCVTFVLVLFVPYRKTASRDGILKLYRGDQVLELAQSGVDTTPLAEWHYGEMPWGMLELELMNC